MGGVCCRKLVWQPGLENAAAAEVTAAVTVASTVGTAAVALADVIFATAAVYRSGSWLLTAVGMATQDPNTPQTIGVITSHVISRWPE